MQTDASNVKLPDLFANKCFRIPNYQRGYAWGESQLNDLWDDIMDIQKNGATYRPHYTGTLTLQQIDLSDLTPAEKELSKSGMEYYNVVDGQQRLTTLVILLNSLAKKTAKGKKQLIENYIKIKTKQNVCRFAYGDTNGDSYRFFMKNIIGEANTLPYNSTIYTSNLENASQFFESKLSTLDTKELNKLREKLFTSLVFDTKYIQNNLDVQAVFETMNNRGKPLTTLEKLKNRLLYMTSKFDTTVDIKGLSDCINNGWGLIYETLGKNKDNMLSEDEFLSAYLTLLREPNDYSFSEYLAGQKVFQMFCNHATDYDFSMARQHDASKEPVVDENKIKSFVSGMANFVMHWYVVYFPDLNTERGIHIQKIKYLNGSKEMRIFLAKLLMMADDAQYTALVDECLDMTEKVLFRNALPGVSLLDERRFATRARDLHNGELTLDDLRKELDNLLLQHIDVQSLISGFRYLFTYVRGNIGFHRWRALKFFLMEYENHIRGNNLHHVNWDNYYYVQIEHIMPTKWSTHWSLEMNDYLDAHQFLNNDERERAKNILINSLGNLTVIQDIKNAGIGNNPWTIKQKAYNNGSYSEIEIATNISWHPWGHASIKDRGKKMLDFMCDYLEHHNHHPLTITQNDYTSILFFEAKYD